jgi:hypothetical protein
MLAAERRYHLLTPRGREGPYSEVDLLDLLDAKEITPSQRIQDGFTEQVFPVSQLFETFEPEVPVSVKMPEMAMGAPKAPEASAGPLGMDSEENEEFDPNDEQEEEEEMPSVLYSGHPSIFSYTAWLLAAALAVGVGYLFPDREGNRISWGVGIGLGLLGIAWLLRLRRTYVVTPLRVEMLTGWIVKSSREVRISDIRTINVIYSGLAGLLGIGSVEFSSSGTEDGEVRFQGVFGGHQLKRLVRQLQEEQP